MKKGLFVAALGVLILSSCAKDYVCECEVTGTVDIEMFDIRARKKEAQNNCNALNDETRTCELLVY